MKVGLSDHFTYSKLIRFVAPSIVMMIVTSIYNIVDGFFVSNFAGKNAFAAVNLIMPVLMALGSFGFMIGTGGSALVAFTLGEGKKEKANRIFSMLIASIAIIGVTLSVLAFVFMRRIALALGASELILDTCVLYGRISVFSMTFFMMQNSFQSFFVTAEKAQLGLLVSIAAGVNNMVLDFVLVYVLRLGAAGAAIATVLSETLGGLLPMIYFLRKNNSRLRLVRPEFDFRALWKAITNGSSEMLTSLSSSFIGMLYNFQLMRFAAENGVAAYGVIMYISFIFMALFLGYSIGCGPLVGYHYGANHRQELKNILRKSLTLIGIIAVVITLLSQMLTTPLTTLFVGYDAELCALASNALRIYSLSFLLSGFNIFGSAFFTGLNNGKLSAIISSLRTLILQTASIIILPMLFGLNGIWTAVIAAESLTLLVTVSLLVIYRPQYGY